MPNTLKYSNLPDSELCVAAIEYARSVSEPSLFHHVMRSAIFADVIGRKRKMNFDPEVLCAATVLHDLGLTKLAAVEARFELEGADAAKEFLVKKGMSERNVEIVWEAIALHTTAEIPSRRSSEVALCQMGIFTDLFTLPADLMTAEQLDEIFEAFPWLGLNDALPSTLVGLFKKNPKVVSSNAVADACALHVPTFKRFNFCEHIVSKQDKPWGTFMKVFSNGINLNVLERGKGEIALVFLHYWGGSARTWNPVMDFLSKEFRSIAIDLRGWGESEKPASGYSIRNQADDVEGVIRELGLNRYYLVGHSMGAKIAEVLASRKPKGLEGLILVAGASPTPSKIPLERRNAMVHVYDSRESILGAINNVLTTKKLTAEVQEQVIEDSFKGGKEAKHAWPTSGMVEDISDVFDVTCPTLIIAGDKDKVDNPEMLKTDLLPNISGAQFHSIPDAGHLLPLEVPEEVGKAVRDFIRNR